MSDEPPYHVEIKGVEDEPSAENQDPKGKPWIGICFDCCGVYTRVYRNPEGTAYIGRCPRCLRGIRLRIGPGGTNARFFRAD